MRWWIVLAFVFACRGDDDRRIMIRWDGGRLVCTEGTLVIRDVQAVVAEEMIYAAGTCRLQIEHTTLKGKVAISVDQSAVAELRDVGIDGSLVASGHAQVTAVAIRPASDGTRLNVLADGDSHVKLEKSYLRGVRPVSANTRGAVVLVDCHVDALEKDGTQMAIYTWASGRVEVRGGSIVGQAVAQNGGPMELAPTVWTSPSLETAKTLAYVRCLATTDVQMRNALGLVAAGGAPALSSDWTRVCADEITRLAATKPRDAKRDDSAATWAALLLPIAGKLDQLRRYVEAGDDKDDKGARGTLLREQLATAATELDAASVAFTSATMPDRARANAQWRGKAGTLEAAVIDMFIAAETLALTREPDTTRTALEAASTTSTALFDLVADRTTVDRVGAEAGSSWGTLENALRALHDEIKRVRRGLIDANTPVGLARLARISELIMYARDQYAHLKFPPPAELTQQPQ